MKKIMFFVLLFCVFLPTKASSSFAIKDNLKKANHFKIDIKIDSGLVSKINFQSNFKTKYKNSAFDYAPKIHKQNAWDRFKDWLSRFFMNLFRFSNQFAAATFVEVLLKIIAIIIIVLAVYFIIKNIINNEGQWVFGKNSDKKMNHFDEVEKNLMIIDFEKLIHQQLQFDQKRLCIRYYYLWFLKKMTENQVIIWEIEKTNDDYLREIKMEDNRKQFAYLSYIYENIWYGEFELNNTNFETAKTAFETAIQSHIR